MSLLATNWTTEGSDFESQEGQSFSLLHVVQTDSLAQAGSYPMGNNGSFPRGKEAEAWSWPFTSNVCRVEENLGLYIHSPIPLHGVVLN
jgi:hypothetical protein